MKSADTWRRHSRERRERCIRMAQDLRRSIDYLQTRPDIDSGRLVYFGVSLGAGIGPIPLALEDRLKAAVLADGGLSTMSDLPEVDPLHFAPRVRIPVVMLNGRNDFLFPSETSQSAFSGCSAPGVDTGNPRDARLTGPASGSGEAEAGRADLPAGIWIIGNTAMLP